MANEQNLKPFKKGDVRINRKGRPRTFDQLRALAQQIAQEVVDTKQGKFSTVEVIMRQWATSKDPRLVQAFIAYAYGKVPDIIAGMGDKGEVVIRVVHDDK